MGNGSKAGIHPTHGASGEECISIFGLRHRHVPKSQLSTLSAFFCDVLFWYKRHPTILFSRQTSRRLCQSPIGLSLLHIKQAILRNAYHFCYGRQSIPGGITACIVYPPGKPLFSYIGELFPSAVHVLHVVQCPYAASRAPELCACGMRKVQVFDFTHLKLHL